MKVQESGKITARSFKGNGLPNIYGYTRGWGPTLLPVISATRDPGKRTYTVTAPSGILSDPGPITLRGVRLFWSYESACRSWYQTKDKR